MYFGGKNGSGVYQTIINYIPPHRAYIELFLGSGAILCNKKTAEINIGIEINRSVMDKFNYPAGSTIICDDVISWIKCNLLPAQTIKPISASKGEYIYVHPKDIFIYADPPYPIDSRRNKVPVYKNELTDDDHIELLKELKQLKCQVAISTYPNSIYMEMLKGWNLVTFQAQTRKGPATECLYMNYEPPQSCTIILTWGPILLTASASKEKLTGT